MSIKDEVHVRKLLCHPIASFNEGRYVIQPFECEVTGTADGRARVKASMQSGRFLSLRLQCSILCFHFSVQMSLRGC